VEHRKKEKIEEVDDIEAGNKLEHIEKDKTAFPEKRFCEVCQVVQPYRSRHCWDCNRCIRKFDHHCFWVGGCVGELNHGKFWLFLFFQTWQECLSFVIAQGGHAQASINFPNAENDIKERK